MEPYQSKFEEGDLSDKDFVTANYVINGKYPFRYERALQIWKAKYKTYDAWEKGFLVHAGRVPEVLYPLRDMVKPIWDDIVPLSQEEMNKLFPVK